eukprot:COSAG05_NODE_1829_length_4002_cov_3.573917_3_plen_81_part_00
MSGPTQRDLWVLYGKHRYEHVIYACALTDDLDILPAGDTTQIGGTTALFVLHNVYLDRFDSGISVKDQSLPQFCRKLRKN